MTTENQTEITIIGILMIIILAGGICSVNYYNKQQQIKEEKRQIEHDNNLTNQGYILGINAITQNIINQLNNNQGYFILELPFFNPNTNITSLIPYKFEIITEQQK